ncbi:hypothetical protein VP01_3756g1 [Puccinia sorghi]|uniref:Uncharacterized protein n=1 Tax=Puccinia sorghi TaxID=27349 RepID=A0A0L6UTX9_9BASI|nr:hypothetical protein VP01_3756g1 [Puccinia sorghi]
MVKPLQWLPGNCQKGSPGVILCKKNLINKRLPIAVLHFPITNLFIAVNKVCLIKIPFQNLSLPISSSACQILFSNPSCKDIPAVTSVFFTFISSNLILKKYLCPGAFCNCGHKGTRYLEYPLDPPSFIKKDDKDRLKIKPFPSQESFPQIIHLFPQDSKKCVKSCMPLKVSPAKFFFFKKARTSNSLKIGSFVGLRLKGGKLTRLAQDGAGKEGEEPMRLIACTRLSFNRLDTSGALILNNNLRKMKIIKVVGNRKVRVEISKLSTSPLLLFLGHTSVSGLKGHLKQPFLFSKIFKNYIKTPSKPKNASFFFVFTKSPPSLYKSDLNSTLIYVNIVSPGKHFQHLHHHINHERQIFPKYDIYILDILFRTLSTSLTEVYHIIQSSFYHEMSSSREINNKYSTKENKILEEGSPNLNPLTAHVAPLPRTIPQRR